MPADLALRYDPDRRRCGLVFAGRDLALDGTAETPLLVSIGSDRRARRDDPVPGDPDSAATIGARRGWAGDALGAPGDLIGSRLWLLVRAKETEATRRRAEAYAAEAIAWLARRGLAPTAEAQWIRPGVLAVRAAAGAARVAFSRSIGAS